MKKSKLALVLALVIIPVTALAFVADNVLLNPGAEPLKLDRDPTPGTPLNLAVEPDLVVSPYRVSDESWPGYLVSYRFLQYEVAISCGTDIDQPCNPLLVGDPASATKTIRYVQTSDNRFTTAEGLRIGDGLLDVLAKLNNQSSTYSGNGECIVLPSGWNACFYSDDLVYNIKDRSYTIKDNARVNRFLK
jgi:hypothetical protein